MKQIFIPQTSRYNLLTANIKPLLVAVVAFLVIIWFAATTVVFIKLLFVSMVIIVSFVVTNSGRLELDNGILSRRNFIKYWSIDVSSITDIISGVSRGFGTRRGHPLIDHSKGLSFKTKEEKFYEFPSDIQNILVQDGTDFISILKKINPSVQFHFDAKSFRGQLGWKGDKRLARRRMFLILFVLISFVVLAVMHNIFHII